MLMNERLAENVRIQVRDTLLLHRVHPVATTSRQYSVQPRDRIRLLSILRNLRFARQAPMSNPDPKA